MVFAIIFAVYLFTLLSYFPDTRVIERAAETINGYDNFYPPFRMDEHTYYDIAKSVLAGEIYQNDASEFYYPIGFPLVAAPFVALFGEVGIYLANLLILWFSAILFFLIARRFTGPLKALILTIILAFATLNWFYANSGYSEPLSQLLVLSSLAFLTTLEKQNRRRILFMLLAGFLLGLNLFVRPHYILLAIPFFGYLVLKSGYPFRLKWETVAFFCGTAFMVFLWFVRNWLVYGSPMMFEYTRLADQFSILGNTKNVEGNIIIGTHRVLFDIYHGLLTITPIFLLFPAGLKSMWVKGYRHESLLLLVSAVIMILFIASGPYPFTEFGLGSRHLVPLIPILLLPAAFFLDFSLFRSTILILLAVYSFYFAGIGWLTGTEPGVGFFIGILNDNQARAIILARKGLLPKKTFKSREEIIEAYRKAIKNADLYDLLQTLHQDTREKIKGNERAFLIQLYRDENPMQYIGEADPDRGITMQILINK